jgi:hypothetical protein
MAAATEMPEAAGKAEQHSGRGTQATAETSATDVIPGRQQQPQH